MLDIVGSVCYDLKLNSAFINYLIQLSAMRNLILPIGFAFAFSMCAFAQNTVHFNLNHMLGQEPFAMGTGAQNNLGHDFNVSRLQYYISKIAITHDGGMTTWIEDLWILVDAGQPTLVDLGSHDINHVEKVGFHIGVDPDHNHSDPATYPQGHPLAPQFPSMHWGWSAGYRFVAFEGMGGPAYDQTIQLHGLADSNYFQVKLIVDIPAVNHAVVINVDADYTRALEDIEVNGGIFVHGGFAEAKQILENFRDYVFTPGEVVTGTTDLRPIANFDVYPNPSDGRCTILLDADEFSGYEVSVSDLLGRQVQSVRHTGGHLDMVLRHEGMYIVQLMKEGHPLMARTLIVQ